jgi:hypothetical protein
MALSLRRMQIRRGEIPGLQTQKSQARFYAAAGVEI